MNKLFVAFVILIAGLNGCKTKKQEAKLSPYPVCIGKAIETFSKSGYEHISVKEYTFQNKQVFVFDQSQQGNDMTSEVLDNNCKSLGYLGGFVGNTQINGEDFSNALLIKTIWERNKY